MSTAEPRVVDAELVVVDDVVSREETPGDSLTPSPGQWYWLTGEDKEWDDETEEYEVVETRDLVCVMHVGTNYAEIRYVSEYKRTERVHFDEWLARTTFEPNSDAAIDRQILKYKQRASELMGEVQDTMGRLSDAMAQEAQARAGNGADTQALATLSGVVDVTDYKNDLIAKRDMLVKAETDGLPELYKEISATTEEMAIWMMAKTYTLQAMSGGMGSEIEQIKKKIFAVELYSGLTEDLVQFAEGTPAAIDAKLHIMQRRCYMDEECLARYEVGGMVFKDIHAFDKWLSKPENRDRILPFPRCMVAFRVRRNRKDRGVAKTMGDAFIQMMAAIQDESTYLYLRNGDNLFWLKTSLEFGANLFPDFDRSVLSTTEALWAKHTTYNGVEDFITDSDYKEQLAKYKAERKAWSKKRKAFEKLEKLYQKKVKAWTDARTDPTDPESEPTREEMGFEWMYSFRPSNPVSDYSQFNQDNIYHDDIAEALQKQIDHYNRVSLIIQGLFDRSPAFAPHHKVKTWTAEGFDEAIKPIYDNSRAVSDGDPPDIAAYIAGLAAQIEPGSVVCNQQRLWERGETEKYNARQYGDGIVGHYTPWGSPGPGRMVIPDKVGKKKVTFQWMRKRRSRQDYYDRRPDEIQTSFTCEKSALFNISAYKPGDFRQFYDDPRTRANYLKWAPLMLRAEEYHAGNLKLGNDLTLFLTCEEGCGKMFNRLRKHACRAKDLKARNKEWNEHFFQRDEDNEIQYKKQTYVPDE